MKSHMLSELQSHIVSFIKEPLQDREVQQERRTQNLEYQEAQLRVQVRIEELMMTSLEESFSEPSESDRQAVISDLQCVLLGKPMQ